MSSCEVVVCENFNPKTDSLLISLMRQASCKCETPRLELKSSQTFLAIKRYEGTKIGKVIKQSIGSIYKLAPLGVFLLNVSQPFSVLWRDIVRFTQKHQQKQKW